MAGVIRIDMKIEIVRWVAAVLLGLFSCYTIYCIRRENFWKACRGIFAYRWGRQVTVDLYLGLFLFVFLIYLNENSASVAMIWLVPTLVLGNIIPLLYFVLYFDSIVQRFSHVM